MPGFMQRGDAWRPIAERIATSYRSRTVDHRADTYSGRLEEIASEMSPDIVLCGYSMGGRLALHAAIRRPRALRALVVVGASAGIEDEALRERRREADERLADWMEQHSIEEIVERWERVPALATQSTDLRDELRPGRLSHEPAELASLLRTAGQGTLPPVWGRLPDIDCPVLVVAGEADDAYVAAAYRMVELLPRGAARLVQGAGHSPQLEQPAAFATLLTEFLEGLETAELRGSSA